MTAADRLLLAAAWKQATPQDRKRIAASMSEDDLVSAIIDEAHDAGWLAVHHRPAQTAKGYRTAVQGDKGDPDLLLSRAGVVLLIEAKSEKGTLSPEQKLWRDAVGASWWLWRPSMWLDGTVAELLR